MIENIFLKSKVFVKKRRIGMHEINKFKKNAGDLIFLEIIQRHSVNIPECRLKLLNSR